MVMDQVIVAFENKKNCERVREIIECSGAASCIVCHSAAEVKRAVAKQHLTTVICGFKLPDEPAESLFGDLPSTCSMLMVAVQDLLDLCQTDEIFKLSSPVSRGDLTASVRMLLQMSHRLEKYIRPQRSEQEVAVIQEAKAVLMDRYGMSEAQAHRFLQKKSMDAGAKMVQTARLVLTSQ